MFELIVILKGMAWHKHDSNGGESVVVSSWTCIHHMYETSHPFVMYWVTFSISFLHHFWVCQSFTILIVYWVTCMTKWPMYPHACKICWPMTHSKDLQRFTYRSSHGNNIGLAYVSPLIERSVLILPVLIIGS